uniref:Cuticle protein 6 n=1 Tax=Timema monikensis TaxID=170555 RepID=A0A7R9HM64_9NEOP|nr:unnamed protein product [Timema monikensis]
MPERYLPLPTIEGITNPDLTVIDSPVYCESDALDHVATEAVHPCLQGYLPVQPCLQGYLPVQPCLQDISRSTPVYKDISRSNPVYKDISRSITVCKDISRSTPVCKDISRSITVYKDISRSITIVLGALVSASTAQLLYPLPYAVPAPLAVAVPFIGAISSQFHAQDELGQFTFATAGDNQVRTGDNQVRTGDNQARTEVKTLDGVVRGAYSYVDPTSKLISVNYVADANGYRVVGANNLPEAPAVPSVAGPRPVQDTPEVEAAKADFQKKFIEAAAAAEASPDVVSRRRRSAVLYTPIVPAVAKTNIKYQTLEAATIKYQTLEAVDAPTPADTHKIELKEKESEVVLPYAIAPAPLVIAPSPDVKTAGIHVLSPYQASNIVVL